jgi:hypothetical protein
MRFRRPLIPTSLLAAAAVAVLAAGCGAGSEPPTGSGAAHAATTDLASETVAFATCMRSHGLPGYPDPKVSQSAGHSSMRISPGGLDPNSQVFKSATRTCGHLLPELGAPSGAVGPKELRFASCMRGHGVPSFPDPDHDGAFTLPAEIDQQAPQFKRAITDCATFEPSSLSILTQPPSSS